MRLFVALPVPEAERRRLAAAAAALRPRLPAARWVPAANLHLTLFFLGETDAGLVPELGQALARCFDRFPPLHLRLAEPGCFPPRRPARVAWLGLDADATLGELQRSVAGAVTATTGAAPERRPYHPHLTLARCRHPWPRPAVELWTAGFGDCRGRVFAVAAGELMESRLGPGGARYRSLASYPLAGAGNWM